MWEIGRAGLEVLLPAEPSVPGRPEPVAISGEWTRVSGQFVTPLSAARGCLKINIEGFTDQGAGLGEVCVDDVYVGRGREGQP